MIKTLSSAPNDRDHAPVRGAPGSIEGSWTDHQGGLSPWAPPCAPERHACPPRVAPSGAFGSSHSPTFLASQFFFTNSTLSRMNLKSMFALYVGASTVSVPASATAVAEDEKLRIPF